MGMIRIKDANGGYDLPHMDKNEAIDLMQARYKEGGLDAIPFKVCHAKGIILTSDGMIRLSMRPPSSKDNGGLFDTSWGSHIASVDSLVTSAMAESARELGVATTIFDEHTFYPMLEVHPNITRDIAVTREIAYERNFVSERVLANGERWEKPCEMTVFVSYYDGKYEPEPKDGRMGPCDFKLETLQALRQSRPDMLTPDLIYILDNYAHELVRYKDLKNFCPNPHGNIAELIQPYGLNGEVLDPVPRKTAHDEAIARFHAGKRPKEKHAHIRLMLMRPDGTWYLSKRSAKKKENYGLIDKPVAGHLSLGDIPETACLHETSDEVSIPGAILSEEDLLRVVRHRPEILKHQAVIMRADYWEDYVSKGRTLQKKLTDGTFEPMAPWDELCDTTIFLGVYNGHLRLKDNEATGFEVDDLDALEKQVEADSGRYTTDIPDLIRLIRTKRFAEKVAKAQNVASE